MKPWRNKKGSFDCEMCHRGYMGYSIVKKFPENDTIIISCNSCGYYHYTDIETEKYISQFNKSKQQEIL
jgi:transcription elongation factor Elf1